MLLVRAALAATILLAPMSVSAAPTPRQTTVTAKPFAVVSKTVLITQNPVEDRSAATSGVALAQFDTSGGILVGATLDVDLPLALRMSAAVTGQGGGTVETSYTGRIGIPLDAPITAAPLAVTRECGSNGRCSTSPTVLATRLKGTANVAAGGLATFAGMSTASIGLEAVGSLKGTKTNPTTSGRLTPTAEITFGTDAVGATNSVAMTYSYLDFATPSFSSTDPTVTALALDFGRLATGSGAKTLAFSLNNIGGASTAGLSLMSISTTGGGFTTDLTTFTNGLAGGQSGTYSITLNPTTAGAYDQSLALTFADFAPSGAVGVRSYTMFLSARAYVGAVPEPASWSMMIAGFGMIGAAARRRRRAAA